MSLLLTEPTHQPEFTVYSAHVVLYVFRLRTCCENGQPAVAKHTSLLRFTISAAESILTMAPAGIHLPLHFTDQVQKLRLVK